MDCVGTVISSDPHKAVVRVERGNCGECKGCGLLSRASGEAVVFEVPNRLEVDPGDQVVLRMPPKRLLHAYLLAFGLPVVAMLAGYLLGSLGMAPLMSMNKEPLGVILALISGLIAFWSGLRMTRRLNLEPRMENVVYYYAGRAPANPSEDTTTDDLTPLSR